VNACDVKGECGGVGEDSRGDRERGRRKGCSLCGNGKRLGSLGGRAWLKEKMTYIVKGRPTNKKPKKKHKKHQTHNKKPTTNKKKKKKRRRKTKKKKKKTHQRKKKKKKTGAQKQRIEINKTTY